MLTGDSHGDARRRSPRELGVDEVRAELLPEDKVDGGRRRCGGGTASVAMVGDGVNDAPALAAADVGIAMGAAGSDAALETADVALMADELLKIPYALRLSRATLRNIKINLAISLVLKAAFVVAAVAGVATLWMAVLADTGASVIVIANALQAAARGLTQLTAGQVAFGSTSRRPRSASQRRRQPDPRHAQPVERLDAQRSAFDLDRVADARAAAEAAQHVAAERRVRSSSMCRPNCSLMSVTSARPSTSAEPSGS